MDLTGQTFSRLFVISEALPGWKDGKRGRKRYLCRCECGKEIVTDGSKLKNGHTKSCGCAQKGSKRPNRAKPHGEALRRRLLNNYKSNARRRNLEFSLTDQEAYALYAQHCYYCGIPPARIMTHPRMTGEYRYNGIDRYVNSKGYITGNVVPCCAECNERKGPLDGNDFLAWVRRIANHHPDPPLDEAMDAPPIQSGTG